MDTQKFKRIYITLDSLLDTRLGVMNTINTDFAVEVTSQESYFKRQIDVFKSDKLGTLSNVLFDKVLKERKELVIRNSLKTKMPFFLSQLCNIFIQQAISSPVAHDLQLDVNIYPFTLSDAEAKIITDAISKSIGNMFTINIINYSYNQLTIDYVRDNYKAMIMYHYHEWLNMHDKESKSKPLKETSLYVPKIFFGSLPTEEQWKKLDEIGKDPFELTQKILSPILPIEYLPISLYCVDTPLNKKEYAFT